MKTNKLLLIDDDTFFGKMFASLAAVKGVQVDYFESLTDALYGSQLNSYDAAVIDCCMPECTGFETSEYFQTFFRKMPVILISAKPDSADKYANNSFGARAYVSKDKGVSNILDVALAKADGGLQ